MKNKLKENQIIIPENITLEELILLHKENSNNEEFLVTLWKFLDGDFKSVPVDQLNNRT